MLSYKHFFDTFIPPPHLLIFYFGADIANARAVKTLPLDQLVYVLQRPGIAGASLVVSGIERNIAKLV